MKAPVESARARIRSMLDAAEPTRVTIDKRAGRYTARLYHRRGGGAKLMAQGMATTVGRAVELAYFDLEARS